MSSSLPLPNLLGRSSATHLVVKHTFLELEEQSPLVRRCRRTKTDSVLLGVAPGARSTPYLPADLSCSSSLSRAEAEGGESGGSGGGSGGSTPRQPTGCEAVTEDGSEGPRPRSGRPRARRSRRTTVMLRNVPNNYTRGMLLATLDREGFRGKYDFVYLPVDFQRKAGLGYAFVNLVEPSLVPEFWRTFDGFSKWSIPTSKVCEVSWSQPHQGLTTHIERYKNSPVMHSSVPDHYKPAIFAGGVRQPFPPPSREISEPRRRA